MMTHEQHRRKKRWHEKKRGYDAKHKANERLRTANYQRLIDYIARSKRKKGNGRAFKVKGETMPTMFCANSRTAKSWKHLNGKPMRGESMKVAIIWDRT